MGEISQPIRTEFGYHVIEKTGERDSPQAQAAELVEALRADPDSFGETATQVSEDAESAANDGELGWVARYQLDEVLEDAVFALTEVGEIGDPVDTATRGHHDLPAARVERERGDRGGAARRDPCRRL